MMILQPHDSARLVAAILHKLGETSITISAHDLQNLPVGQVEAHESDDGQTVTYRFRQYDQTGQGALGFDEPVPDLPPIGEDEMPQTRAREHVKGERQPFGEPAEIDYRHSGRD